MVERNLTGLLQSGEHHTHYPERDDIITRYQDIRRIEILQFRCLLRPSQCGKRPQSGTEPGVQSIRILGEMGMSAFRADRRSAASLYDQLPALVTGISRDPMSPPQLSGDTPVTDIFQPVEIRFFKTLRNKVCFSALYRLDRRFSHIRHLYKPLGFYHRLDGCLAAVMGSYVVNMILYFYEKSLCLKIRNHCLSRLIAVHTCVFSALFIHGRVIIHDIDLRQVVASSHLEIVGVMCRCDLYASGSELFVYIGIRDHRNLTVCQRKLQHLSDKILIALIFRINRNGGIPQKGFRTGRGDLNISAFLSNDWIIDMPEMSRLFLVLYLGIGNGGLTYRTPVDNAAAFIDPSFFVQTAEYFFYSLGTALIHRETFSVPICGRAQFFQLVVDPSAVLLFPFPAVSEKFFAADLILVDAFFFQHLGYFDLCGDRRMVGSRLPEGLISLHSLEARQDILHGVVQRMAHMKLAGYVRRRHHDGKRFFVWIYFGMKISSVHPFLIKSVLDPFRIVGFGKLLVHFLPP